MLFLVGRGNLGRQTLQEFQQYTAPDDGRKFTELYNVQHLTSNQLDSVSKVTITTIQRLYSMLRDGAEYDAGNEERSGFELNGDAPQRPREVAYIPAVPPEAYDFVVIDEYHRSIYNVWQQVLEYFDAHLIGLTATPAKQTFGFFNQNLVMEYSHERAVVDGVNVGSDVFRIRTAITEQGARIEADSSTKRMERQTRKKRWETLDDDLVYAGSQLDRSVTAPDQIRTVREEWKARLFTELFPGRGIVPKTLIFAKSDHHAAEIIAEVERRLTVLDALSQTLPRVETRRAPEPAAPGLHRPPRAPATDEPAAAPLARLYDTPAAGPAKGKAGRGRKAPAQQTTLGL